MNPSPWITRFGPGVAEGATVLDVACGSGRHTRWFADHGYRVIALDRDLSGVADLHNDPRVDLVECDLEVGAPVPVDTGRCAAVVVTNYLWRPILDELVARVASGGWLLYETFAVGNEQFGRPTNPEYLLRPGELLDLAHRHAFRVVAYEDVAVAEPRPAAVQRVAALNVDRASTTTR
jgi:SAM-dependent methyltransferase